VKAYRCRIRHGPYTCSSRARKLPLAAVFSVLRVTTVNGFGILQKEPQTNPGVSVGTPERRRNAPREGWRLRSGNRF
jgi:hypothetical protein